MYLHIVYASSVHKEHEASPQHPVKQLQMGYMEVWAPRK